MPNLFNLINYSPFECASEKSAVIMKDHAYSHQIRKPSYENHNIKNCLHSRI